MKKTLLLLIILFSINCYSQFSKTHYIPPLTSGTSTAVEPQDHYLYISTPSLIDVKVKVIEIGGSVFTRSINKNNPWIYTIGSGNNTQIFTPNTTIGKLNNKGYIVEAEDLIYTSFRTNVGAFNQAGGLVSKGNSALGKDFRIGAMLNKFNTTGLMNFASILAVDNGTNITISDIPIGTVLTDGTPISGTLTFTLNKNESYVLAMENNGSNFNSTNIIGSVINSNKDIVVNAGSFGGSNYEGPITGVSAGRDVGFDQIVSFEKTGKEYIFIRGLGSDVLERVLLIAHIDNTKIYVNGNTTPIIKNAGENLLLEGSSYSNNIIYVTSSENIFAYQSIGGSISPANQNLFFVPPINCSTPTVVDNIPNINSIGTTSFSGSINVVTESGATVLMNDAPIPSSPISIDANPGFVYYSVNGLSGNVSVKSTKQVYVSYNGTNGAATYGGYYSGFDLKPEIISEIKIGASSNCIPNVVLKISALTAYDTFQWYFNDVAIDPIQQPDAITNTYTPRIPGFYQVKGSISGCLSDISSDKIPVSSCPTDLDNDNTNDNIDIDLDNDGITNCTESYGDQNLNLLNPATGTISVGSYSNSFTGTVTTFGTGLPMGTFTGNTNGSFITEVPAGKGNSVTYKLNFARPMSVGVEYASTANPSDLLNANAEYIVNSDIDKTITVLNPDNQLLIDTNYDGIYESGITQYSSFEIRFRLNSVTALAAGTGTFKFLTYLTNKISFTHKNLTDDISNKATLKFFATCVPKDFDSDGNPDQLDTDSDNDGIPDTIEAQQNISVNFSNSDTNNNGLDNAFEPGFTPIDNDNDGSKDYLDLDSDNDGILDLVETGVDTDADGIRNYRDLDSDNDLCNDVNEAGFSDSDNDGKFGNSPISVDSKGLVIGAPYTIPNPDYLISAPIIITKQPTVASTCELQNAEITLVDNGGNTYQWQLLTSGIWTDIIDGTTYTGGKTNTLLITRVKNEMNGYKYRVKLEKNGNSCGLISSETTLTIYALPVVSPITIVQCDDDTDGFSDFNLTIKNNEISSNATTETFTYYTSLAGAEKKDSSLIIPNPTAFRNTASGNMKIWANIENENGCYSIAEITLIVSTTKIPASFYRSFSICDDLGAANNDTDGIATFDFSSVTAEIEAILPAATIPYSIKYYKNEPDALSESDEITNTSNYRNEGYPNEQKIWVRVESTVDNACFGLSPRITLTVNPKPNIDTNADSDDNELVCSNLPTFFVTLDAGIQDGTPSTDYTYVWTKDNVILTSETNSTLNVNTEGNYAVEVSSLAGCSRIRNIKVTASDIAQITNILIVDLSDVNSVTVNVTGKGQYQFSLDAPSGPFQDSNFFDNVTAGIHEVYINDKNGCGTVSKSIAVIGIPKFFTPNGDGYNDYWNVKGVNENFNENSIIYIFDRYGKLLKQIVPSSQGWDGTFVGQPLSADDYWYSIKLVDGREVKGHFSLKR